MRSWGWDHGPTGWVSLWGGNVDTRRNARTQRKGHVRTQWEGGHLQTKDRGAPGDSKPANTWSRTSSHPDNKKMNFCCLSHQYVVLYYSSPSKLTRGIQFSLGSSPQSFWHQGPVSWKTVFPWMGWGQGWFPDDSSTLYLVCTLFLLLLY